MTNQRTRKGIRQYRLICTRCGCVRWLPLDLVGVLHGLCNGLGAVLTRAGGAIVIYILAQLLRSIDAVERAYWRRIAGILLELGPVDTRRFMYGRD